jgi:hypothetical protein
LCRYDSRSSRGVVHESQFSKRPAWFDCCYLVTQAIRTWLQRTCGVDIDIKGTLFNYVEEVPLIALSDNLRHDCQ